METAAISLCLFFRLNQPGSLSLSPSTTCAVPLTTLVALCWVRSSVSVFFLYWGAQSWAQHPRRVSGALSRGGGKRLPWLAGHTFGNAAQDGVHVQLVYQHPVSTKLSSSPGPYGHLGLSLPRSRALPLYRTPVHRESEPAALSPELLLCPKAQRFLVSLRLILN